MTTKPSVSLLSLDPGTNNMGVAVHHVYVGPRSVRIKLIKHGQILSTLRTLTSSTRMRFERDAFEKELDAIIKEQGITHIIAERYMIRRGSAGGTTIESVNQMLGLILARRLPVRIIPASQWKNQVNKIEENRLDQVYAEAKEAKLTPHQIDAIHIGRFGIFELLKHNGRDPKTQILVPRMREIVKAPSFLAGESTKIKKPKKKRRATKRKAKA